MTDERILPPNPTPEPGKVYVAVEHDGAWTIVDVVTGYSVHENPEGQRLTRERAEQFAATLNRGEG